jgi:HlyD family secretion protein
MSKRILIPVAILLGLGIGGGFYYWHHWRLAEARSGLLTLYGNIDVRLVNLAFNAEGRIAAMNVDEGAQVKAGDVLATLDTRPLKLAHDAAVANAAAQRERVQELEAGTRPEEIRKLEAQVKAARTRSANLERSYRRIHDLEQKDLASPQQSEDARTAAGAADEDARALEAALALALAGARKEEIAAAKATRAALEADAALAEHNLREGVLHAPSEGIVQSRIMEPGDMASPQRPVYTLARTQPLWARVYLAETELGQVRPGMPARVLSDSFPDKTYAGWVGYISPSAEFTPKSVQTEQTRTGLVYQARVFVCNSGGELRLGMPVTVRLDLDAKLLAQPGCTGDSGP